MKNKLLLFCLVASISVQAGKVKLMTPTNAPSEITKNEEKATLIIHSNTNMHLMKMVYNYYVDDKFIGQDKKNAWFTTEIDPGSHYVYFTIKDDIMNAGKINFEAGKTYYVLRKAVPGGSIMTTQTPDQFKEFLKEEEPEYWTLNSDIGDAPELDADDIKDEQEEFEEESKEDPDKHKDVLEYKGF